jgi:hypothetical protein
VAVVGVILTESPVTTKVPVPLTVPSLAVITAVPGATSTATPRSVASLLIVATDVFDEIQVTDWSTCVLPSVNVPVAVNCCVVHCGDCTSGEDVTAIETSSGGVNVLGWYNSALAKLLSPPDPP